MLAVLKRFVVGGFVVHVATTLIPGRRRRQIGDKGVKAATDEIGPPVQKVRDPFTDPYFDKPTSLPQKIRLVALRPLAVWRWTMLSGVTVSYLVVANVVVMVVRDQGKRYKILKPFTKTYLSRVSLWIMGCR
jgi:hypothetical protein